MTINANRDLFPSSLAETCAENAGEKYRPSNGAEGLAFMERFCNECQKDAAFRDGTGDSCRIVALTLALKIDHPDYPPEWQYSERGQPICTAFEPAQHMEKEGK